MTRLCEQIIESARSGDQAYEERRLRCLVSGAVEQILRSTLSHGEATDLITRHVEGLVHRREAEAPDVGPAPTAA